MFARPGYRKGNAGHLKVSLQVRSTEYKDRIDMPKKTNVLVRQGLIWPWGEPCMMIIAAMALNCTLFIWYGV